MKETYIEIPSSDNGIAIHGTLRGKSSGPLILLLPGLGGWMHDLQMFNGSRYFEERGYSTLRISPYGHAENQRSISNFGIHEYSKDVDAVCKYLRSKGTDFIAVAGHSYGGLAIAYSKEQNFETGILWDPTHTDGYGNPEAIKNLERDFMYIKELDSYVSGTGPGYVLAKKVFTDHGPGSNIAISKFKKPLLVVNASDTKSQITAGKDYVDNCPAESKQVIIPNSSHPFTEDGAMERLFQATADWVDQIQQA
jgi:esterase/lipase